MAFPIEEFGADVSTFPDLNVTGQKIDETKSVAECVLRRWVTPAGSLSYDRDAGYDLRDLLNDDLTASDLRRHSSRAAIEAEKDERVRSMTVSMTLDPSTFRLVVRARGVLINDREFSFTAAITQISAEFLTTS
jgi:hypothetical protein